VIRVVLAVVLSTALLGIALPAAERAEQERNAELATAELERVAQTADRLTAENDPVKSTGIPAGATLVIEAPASTFAEQGRIRIADGELQWVLPERDNRTIVPDTAVHVETSIVTADRARLRLSFIYVDNAPTVKIASEHPRV